MTQELAWPPSTPDGEPHIDFTRKVLNCSGKGCQLTVVRSQEELLHSIQPPIMSSPAGEAPAAPAAQIAIRRISDEQQEEIRRRIENSMQQTRISFGTTLVLGGCFGGDLPWRVATDESRTPSPSEGDQRFDIPLERLAVVWEDPK